MLIYLFVFKSLLERSFLIRFYPRCVASAYSVFHKKQHTDNADFQTLIIADKKSVLISVCKSASSVFHIHHINFFLELSNTFLLNSGFVPKFNNKPTSISVALKQFINCHSNSFTITSVAFSSSITKLLIIKSA